MKQVLLSPITLEEWTQVVNTAVENVIKNYKPPTPPPDNEYISRKETARILGISLPTLNNYTKRGLISSYRIGSRIRYKKDDVLESLNQRKFTYKNA